MRCAHRFLALSALLWLLAPGAAQAADLGYAAPSAPADKWQFSFTPYGWMINVNGDVTARGHTADVNEDFFQIVEKSDSLLAWMSYFEARKGRVAFFTDLVWMDLGFPGHFQANGSPFKRFPNVNVDVKGKVQLDYQSTIIQSGIAYEVARWERGAGSFTAIDVLGSARYWNLDVDVNLHLTGTITAELERLGLQFKRSGSVAVARGNDLQWVDPVVGGRIRHQIAPGKVVRLEGDIGGFGAGSEFSWQLVGTYGFDTTCLGTPLHAVIGYRALAVDYSERGRYGKDGLDAVQHGPVIGVTFNW
jgi:hypothetical protein